jgi:thiamine-phosphate pyrophosphorylase
VTVDARVRLADARLYLCTDSRRDRGDLAEFLDVVLAAGVDVVQLREKGLEARDELALLERFAEATERHGALFSVNDRADIARAIGAPVLHLGQDDLPLGVARDIVGPETVIGVSTHDPQQLDAALADARVDYFCAGPTWQTPTKPGRPAAGLALVEHATQVAPPAADDGKPWFAIGGIDLDRLDTVVNAGARRVVVVRAVTDAEDPGAAVKQLVSRLRAADHGDATRQK